jgi:glycosyltransferase involved in cell wall biosynthesis
VTTCALVSFRLGATDGVSVVADTWARCLRRLGWKVVTVAGSGPVDRPVPGLEIGADTPPDPDRLEAALADADLVVAENILTIPLNLPASRVVAAVLRGRPAVLHHHDPPWQRERFVHVRELPPDDPAWVHVTINQLTRRQFARRGLGAVTVRNGFDLDPGSGDRIATRRALEVADTEPLVVHPVRAIARKNVPAALALTEAVGGTYWLPGPAEEGYGAELRRLLDRARCRVVRTPVGDRGPIATMADLYAAADLVAFPSLWEGFGNPPVEAAIHRRPAAVGRYPVAEELRALGFRWYDPTDHGALRVVVAEPDPEVIAHNRRVAEAHLGLDRLCRRVNRLLVQAGWMV